MKCVVWRGTWMVVGWRNKRLARYAQCVCFLFSLPSVAYPFRTAGEALKKPVRARSRNLSHARRSGGPTQQARRLTARTAYMPPFRAIATAQVCSQSPRFVHAHPRDDSLSGSAHSAAIFQSFRHSRKPARFNSHATFGDQPTTHSTVSFVECVESV